MTSIVNYGYLPASYGGKTGPAIDEWAGNHFRREPPYDDYLDVEWDYANPPIWADFEDLIAVAVTNSFDDDESLKLFSTWYIEQWTDTAPWTYTWPSSRTPPAGPIFSGAGLVVGNLPAQNGVFQIHGFLDTLHHYTIHYPGRVSTVMLNAFRVGAQKTPQRANIVGNGLQKWFHDVSNVLANTRNFSFAAAYTQIMTEWIDQSAKIMEIAATLTGNADFAFAAKVDVALTTDKPAVEVMQEFKAENQALVQEARNVVTTLTKTDFLVEKIETQAEVISAMFPPGVINETPGSGNTLLGQSVPSGAGVGDTGRSADTLANDTILKSRLTTTAIAKKRFSLVKFFDEVLDAAGDTINDTLQVAAKAAKSKVKNG